jgi:hypothetical protein
MRYKVLLIDDECNTPNGREIIGYAEQEGIDIDAYESHEEGMQVLDGKKHFYHAVILDAKVKKMKDDTTVDLAGLAASRDRLIEINRNEYLPYFIFTAQPDYQKADWFRQSYGDYFIKGDDNQKLLNAIKVAVEKKKEYIVQKKYQRVFEVCTDKYIGTNSANMLLSLLKIVEGYEDSSNSENHLTTVRKIVEQLFEAFKRIGVTPNEVTGINTQSKFLACHEDSPYTFTEEILDKTVAQILKSLLLIAQEGSHIGNIDRYIKQQGTPYLFNSVVFQLLDVLIWFKNYADKHPDIEKNKLLATPLQGKIEQDDNRNYHCGVYLLDYKKVSSNYAVGDKIKITEISKNTNSKTNHLYPKYASKFTKITL